MSFRATVAGDVFQRKVDECFGELKQVTIITDDIMLFGYKPDHNDPDQVFNSLLQIAQKCNVKLHLTSCTASRIKSISLMRPILQVVANQQEQSVSYNSCAFTNQYETSTVFYWHD